MSGKAKEVGIERKNFVGPVCEFIMSGDSNFHHMGIVHHCFFLSGVINLPKIFKNGHAHYIYLLTEKKWLSYLNW